MTSAEQTGTDGLAPHPARHPGVHIHPTATVDGGATIGAGTKVWHYVHIREGARIGRDCIIGKSAYIDKDVVLGERCKVQNFASLFQGVTLGDGVFVGPHVCFTNDLYPRAQNPSWKIVETVVEDGASLGANATLLCGLTVGRYATVAAGSIVTRDVPAHALVMGQPARVVGWMCECGARLGTVEQVKGQTVKCQGCSRSLTIE